MRAFIGAATTGGAGTPATGITVVDVDGPVFTQVGEAPAPDPMYLAHAGGDVLYAVTEQPAGAVRAWRIEDSRLEPLGGPRPTRGAGPCHLSVHPGGRHLLSACYGGGVVTVHPILDDGSLGEPTDTVQHTGSGPDGERQASPHAHMIVTDPVSGPGRGHVLAADLGTDTVYRYRLDERTGTLHLADELRTPPGSGPRHLVVAGRYGYVANELDATVTVLDLDAGGTSSTVSTRPPGAGGTSHPSAIRISADRRFLYVANRFVDEIAVLSVDGPELTLVAAIPCGGDHPRDLALSPDGRWLYSANQFSDAITAFGIDPANGVPEPAGKAFGTPSPACVSFLSA